MQTHSLFSWTRIRRFLNEKLAVNRAVAYMLITRGWQFLSAPITIYLIYKYFGEELQGYYYVFISLLATQIFFELGLNTILSLLASHEWSALALNEQGVVIGEDGPKSRLTSILNYGDRWYRWMTFLFICGLSVIGEYFIEDASDPQKFWRGPWVLAVFVNGVSLCYQPRLAILEGCNQVATVNYVRMFQAVFGTLFVWLVILTGGGLWTIAASNAIRLLFEIYLVNGHYRGMFQSLRTGDRTQQLSWKEEIWPLQWRLAIQNMGGYFSSYFFIPVVDKYHGKAAAGRMGMTWSIISTLQAASQSWTQTRMPEFGMLTAQGRIKELERKMTRIGGISVGLFITTGSAFACAVWVLTLLQPAAANRFLEPMTILVLVVATIVLQVCLLQHSYVRLFKRDPFLVQNVLSTVITGLSAWYFGQYYGAKGIVYSYLAICCLYTLPLSTWILLVHRSGRHLPENR